MNQTENKVKAPPEAPSRRSNLGTQVRRLVFVALASLSACEGPKPIEVHASQSRSVQVEDFILELEDDRVQLVNRHSQRGEMTPDQKDNLLRALVKLCPDLPPEILESRLNLVLDRISKEIFCKPPHEKIPSVNPVPLN